MICRNSPGEETQLKILRFNDDRIGVIKDGNMVVDVSDSVSARKAKGPQRVMEEIIEGWRKYRRRFEKIMAEQSGVPLDSVQLRCPLPRPGKFHRRVQQLYRSPRTDRGQFSQRIFLQISRSGGTGRNRSSCATFPPAWSISPRPNSLSSWVRPPRMCRRIRPWIMYSAMCRSSISQPAAWCGARNLSAKDKDSHGCCGPWIITKDEISDPHNVIVKSWTNGEPRQNYNTGAMAHKIPNQIAWLTRFVTPQPRRYRRHRNFP